MMFLVNETYNGIISEAKMIFARRGKKVVRKFRCTVGKRKGRPVSSPQQCTAPIDIKKRFVIKRMKASMGGRLQRKARITKRMNPASKIVQRLNKARR